MNNSEDESALIESNIRLGKVLHPKFPRLKGTAIRVFSSFCIVIGILSILTQFFPFFIGIGLMKSNNNSGTPDIIGHGFWGGILYVTAGSLGIASTHRHQTKSLLVATVVFSIISIIASFAAALLSALTAVALTVATNDCHIEFGKICDVWRGFEWALLSSHLLAFVSSIGLTVLASIAVCPCCAEPDTLNSSFIRRGNERGGSTDPVASSSGNFSSPV